MINFPINAVHIHLLLNHFPVVLSVIWPVILVVWLFLNKKEVINTSLFIFIFVSLLSIPIYFSWGQAAWPVSAVSWVNLQALVMHYKVATYTFYVLLVLWFLSILTIYLNWNNNKFKFFYYIVLIFSILVLWWVSLTWYYGWAIRHTEIYDQAN
ncbi:MAG: hypothetical protein ACD_4C00324G0001 [uncultured bacterium (gcode 4)]|uniref:Uncharacterized protein n=1 Tax=uncultured bacterium (gcode 4) TaxID=1234023 RepID=K2GSN1_9BACT|nr:MAG: hypothetical protein ACD_4C00324G0001 [uncultured bacterium (gcode 4)]